jgi:predicted dehydrogenase
MRSVDPGRHEIRRRTCVTCKIRLGLIGANVRSNWASRSHLPALQGNPDIELTAVCTTRAETAEEARRVYAARLAFHDYRAMVASPEIDAVAVVVRVPSHFEPTKAAIEAGKHVYTEWPLGRTTSEAEELTALAQGKGVHTCVGLQARVSPALMHMKERIDAGHVGDVTAVTVRMLREGVLARRSDRTWQRDVELGANTLTISYGHTIDALRYVAGGLDVTSAVVSTRVRQWLETDTRRMLDVSSPDNILSIGRLANGAVVSAHVAAIPWAGSGYRMEVYGREGTLVATGNDLPQLGRVRLFGARGANELAEIVPPPHCVFVPDTIPSDDAYNVRQMYHVFAEAIRTGTQRQPTFEVALELHRLLDRVVRAAASEREIRSS